jgi:hypothetical protein
MAKQTITRNPSARQDINYEAWAKNMITFIRERGLEQDFKFWSGGFPCPVESSGLNLLETLKRWQSRGCPDCSGDCGSANPPVVGCIMRDTAAAIAKAEGR